jgi:sugar/nucleoside kinase (ribokinase family)
MGTAQVTARSPVDRPGLDGADRRFSLLVMGDVWIEVRADLPGTRFAEVTEDRLVYAATKAVVSGTGVNLARTATRYFRRTALLAKVGDDDYTAVIRRELRRLKIRDLLRVEHNGANGVAVMLRDQAPGQGHGVRLLVAAREGPNRRINENDVQQAAGEIRRADAIFVDGYALLGADSRAALRAAAHTAREAGTLVAFDLVPHDIDARLAASDVLPLLELADVIITEAPTVARLLGQPESKESAGVHALLPVLDRSVPGRPLWLLRFGATSLERVLAYQSERVRLEYPSGYGGGVERAGFGDRLAACELYWWLSALSSA